MPSAFVLGPRAVSRRSSERVERKSGCPSEASYLIFRPASVAKACEAHEALTFGLLLGQAKSNGKEIHRFALNDKLMVNGYAGLSECKFRKCRESTQITVFVIPNTVRNLAREKEKRFIAPL